ncbi:hypothetical protein WJX73_000524 [Symbiochloris irregularis]|uniref:Uncharacterized protein n=1 Tax=Symbiochloris irregularis TaxID=706552 RepID=A0AAW1NSX2_9CHLO
MPRGSTDDEILQEGRRSSFREGMSDKAAGFWQNFRRAVLPAKWAHRDRGFQSLGTDDAEAPEEFSERRQTDDRGRWCPEESASIISRLFFNYVEGLLRIGKHKPLELPDLWDLVKGDEASAVSQKFQGCLSATADDVHAPQGKVWKAIIKAHGYTFAMAGLLKLVHDTIMFAGPFILEQLLKHLQQGDGPNKWLIGIGWASALAAINMFDTISINQYFHMLFRIALHMKVGLVDMLYRKALKVGCSARSEFGIGSIVNLQSNDAAKLWNLAQYLHMLWSAPFQILVVLGLLVRILSWAPALAGFLVTVALIPCSTYVAKRQASVRKDMMAHTDKRVKLTSEVVSGMKAIKLYAWEQPYTDRILKIREDELREVKRMGLWNVGSAIMWSCGPILITFASFATYTWLGLPLTADVAFPALALFNMLRFPVIMFPNQITNMINGKVALDRVQKFMRAEEMSQPPLLPPAQDPDPTILVNGASFAWESSAPAVLRSVNLNVAQGQLVMVVGEVGSGKSSLLAALLHELRPRGGDVSLAGSVGYTAQDPWICNATLRDNILMGHDYDESRYQQVIQACALGPDLAMLPAGDASEIGEKGINLSGGQRHRVALARACYAAADVYLLDDPLSAVDAHVGRHLFESCICGLLQGCTRVLVTHQVQYLSAADHIVVIDSGAVTHQGTFGELAAKGVDFNQFELQTPAEEEAADEPSAALVMTDAALINVAVNAAEASAMGGADESELTGGAPIGLDTEGPPIMLIEEGETTPHARSVQGNETDPDFPSTPVKLWSSAVTAGNFGGTQEDDLRPDLHNSVPVANGRGPHADISLPVTSGEPSTSASTSDSPSSPNHLTSVPLYSDGSHHKGDESSHVTIELQDRPQKIDLIMKERSGLRTPDRAGKHAPEQLEQLPKGRLVKDEERIVGKVKRTHYHNYLSSWSPYFVLPILLLMGYLAQQGFQVLQNFWLSIWTDATANAEEQQTTIDTGYYVGIYLALGLTAISFTVGRSFCLVYGSLRSGRQLHQRLLEKVIRLPMSFFDTQPSGRLLNRFSRDTEALDTNLGQTTSSFLMCASNVMFSLIVVCSITPAMIFAFVPVGLIYNRVQSLFIASSRELKRLDSLLMSPIFGHFGESVTGLLTLRAFRRQDIFTATNQRMLDASNRTYWLIQETNRWLSLRLELLGIAIVWGTAVFASAFLQGDPGLAGLALTSALSLTGYLNWLVRTSSELEVSMNSVERLVEYAALPPEAPPVIQGHRPPQEWPSQGAISVSNLVVRYAPHLDPVLRNLSFEVRPREKVGIAGRTGCGKSTLMMALWRIVERSSGCISIDGVDIADIGLSDLRTCLALVPQDPVLFSGTVRSNVDPLDQAGADAAVWQALRQAGLGDAVSSLEGGLDAMVSEGGSNFSTGQRQLLCMARALLKRARILVLDEATSNVDHATDALIQRTVRDGFADCTVLTVAHRLHTIIDYDRILLLDQGVAAEFDSPANLLKDSNSAFARMVAESKRASTGK